MNLSKYNTLVECLNDVRKKGYTSDYKLENGKLENRDSNKGYEPNDLEIVAYHRFEGITNPGDMSIVYCIDAKDGSKGTVVNAFGTYANEDLSEFMDQIPVKEGVEMHTPKVTPEDLM